MPSTKFKIARTHLASSSILFCSLATLFVALRALVTDFTHDEAFTFINYVKPSFKAIISGSYPSANNHILNSLLTKISWAIWGNSEFALRLPNVLAFGILIFTLRSWMRAQNFSKSTSFIAFAFVTSAYPLQFFSLSRGYGISFLFLCLSLMVLHNWLKDNRSGTTKWIFIFQAFMVYANLSTGIILLATMIVILGLSRNRLTTIKENLFTGITLITVLSLPVKRLIQENQFYFGGTSGFIQDTMNSLVNRLLNNLTFYPEYIYIIFFMIAIVAIISITKKLQKPIIFLILLFSTIGINLLLHHFAGFKFLMDRTATHYYYLVAFLTIIFVQEAFNDNPVFSYLMGTAIFCHTIFTIHFNYYSEWKYDANNYDIVNTVNMSSKPVILSVDFVHYPGIKYYCMTKGLHHISLHRYQDSIASDFYVFPEFRNIPENISGKMTVFSPSSTILISTEN